MKSLKITLFLLGAITFAAAGPSKTLFHGEVSDTQCAMNVHSLSRSHEEMIQKQTIGTDAASCAKACVRRGGEWVLRSGDDIYRLRNQAGVEWFAGQKVEITGTLDSKTNTIDNTGIEVVPAGKHSVH
jgi:hypothetical protein